IDGGMGVASTSAGERTTSGTFRVASSAMNIDLDVRLVVTGTPDQAWTALNAVYQELAIPLSVNDAATKTLGNTGWRVRRSIGRVPAQRYLDCGSSGTIQNAETYQLTLSIVSNVKPNPRGGSIVTTALSGTGRNPITSSSADVRCVSTGDLELRIREMVERGIVR
ncbi:MAG: hypothetical protein ACKOFO_05025, partial [Gemmatimonadota bacterium]